MHEDHDVAPPTLPANVAMTDKLLSAATPLGALTFLGAFLFSMLSAPETVLELAPALLIPLVPALALLVARIWQVRRDQGQTPIFTVIVALCVACQTLASLATTAALLRDDPPAEEVVESAALPME